MPRRLKLSYGTPTYASAVMDVTAVGLISLCALTRLDGCTPLSFSMVCFTQRILSFKRCPATRHEQKGRKKSDKASGANDGHISGHGSIHTRVVQGGDEPSCANASSQRQPTEAYQSAAEHGQHAWLNLAVSQVGDALVPIEQSQKGEPGAQANPY